MLTVDVLAELQTLAGNSKFEVCGIVDTDLAIHPIKNASPNPTNNFVFDKREYFNLLKKLTREHKQILFIYHTHPSGDATPSQADKSFAKISKRASLIVTKTSFKWVE